MTPYNEDVQIRSIDDCFNNLIIALERLEQYYINAENADRTGIITTAIGSITDYHKEPYAASLLLANKEVELNILSLKYTLIGLSKSKLCEVVSFLIRDTFEWYGGRSGLLFNNVESFAYPLLSVLGETEQSAIGILLNIIKEYVFDETTDELFLKGEITNEDKDNWHIDTFVSKEEINKLIEWHSREPNLTSHKRGDWQDGYKRLKLAFAELYPGDKMPICRLERTFDIYMNNKCYDS